MSVNVDSTLLFQTTALDEDYLGLIPLLVDAITDLNIQYRAFADSAQTEYVDIVRNNHARLLSRIGFVAQDMKDFQNDVANDIENRAIEINDREAECILDAQRELAESAETAGAVIVNSARDWSEGLYFKNDEFVTPALEEIDMITSLFEIEALMIISYYNPVTEMENLVFTFFFEVLIFDILFEIFVDEIYVDFIIFEMLSNEKNEINFPLLDAGLEAFRSDGSLIRSSLANCNA